MEQSMCKKCGKLNPKILQGYHAKELCWCGARKDGDKWIWYSAPSQSVSSPKSDITVKRRAKAVRKRKQAAQKYNKTESSIIKGLKEAVEWSKRQKINE